MGVCRREIVKKAFSSCNIVLENAFFSVHYFFEDEYMYYRKLEGESYEAKHIH